jgi:flagella basal body P-ring formation protein FlgA
VIAAAIAAAGCLSTGTAGARLAAEWQDVGQLEALARTAALRAMPPVTAHQRVQVGPLSADSHLERCADIRAHIAPGVKIRDRTVVELRCESGASWHLYVPVRIVGTATAAVTAHALVTGSVLTVADVTIEERDLTQLPPGYFDEASTVVGLTVARPVAGGAVLTNQQLLGIRAVQRGQTVTLIADAGGMSVRMAGRAMSDGLINQRVRVENLSSGKIVEGIARSQQVVEIVLQ